MSDIIINSEYKIDLNTAKKILNKNQLDILNRMLQSNGHHKIIVTDIAGGYCNVIGKQSDIAMGKCKIPIYLLKLK